MKVKKTLTKLHFNGGRGLIQRWSSSMVDIWLRSWCKSENESENVLKSETVSKKENFIWNNRNR